MKNTVPTEKWILGGLILTQDADRRVLRANIRIRNGRIDAITRSAPRRLTKGVEVIDARGLVVLPGFVQPHIHLCQTLFRNQADDLELLDWLSKRIWRMEAAHTPQTLRVSALLGIWELLSSGTTCILDMATVRHTEAVLEAVEQSGIRASVGKCLMDHPKTTPPYLREKAAGALAEAQGLFDKWNGRAGDRIRVSFAPRFAVSCTEDLLREVAAVARAKGALIHTHASENRGEVKLVRKLTGESNVEHLHRLGLTGKDVVLAHCIWLKSKEMELLRRTGTNVAHCPSSNLKLASGIARVPEMREKGINVGLAADGAPCNNNLSIFHEMRLAALIQKPHHGPTAMHAREVLDMATRDGARALGWFDSIGSIEVGKKADLVALDLSAPENLVEDRAIRQLDLDAIASSVVYASQPSHVRMTMVDGRVLYRDGEVLTIPRKKLLADVKRAQAQIARRLLRQ